MALELRATVLVTGYNVPSSGMFAGYLDWLNLFNSCVGNNYCIDGYFASEPGTRWSAGGVTLMKVTG